MADRKRKSRVTNMILNSTRRTIEYEAWMVDLVLLGVITQEQFEQFTNAKFPENIVQVPSNG